MSQKRQDPLTAANPSSSDLNQVLGAHSGNGEMRGGAAVHHRDFVTAMKTRAGQAVFENLVGQIFTATNAEAEPSEKIGNASKQTDAVNAMAARFVDKREHDLVASAASMRHGRNRDRTDFAEMRAVDVQRAAANDRAFLFGNHEVANVLADVGEGARQQRTIAGVCADERVDLS